MDDSEIINISSLDFTDIKGSENDKNIKTLRSSNFGGGIELLMNDKVKEKSTSYGDNNISDLENDLNELNNLGESINDNYYKNKSNIFSSSAEDEPQHVRFDTSAAPSIGEYTSSANVNDSKTWDGFSKNIPDEPQQQPQPQLSKEELLREKFKYLKKLEDLEKKGVELSKKYNMDSPLAEMQGEYETIKEEDSKKKAVKFQGHMMMAFINGIEFLNNKYDPFDIKLDGWSEQINENINDYDEIFEELHEKYKSKASMAPELKLLFQLGGSAMMIHMSNTLFKSAMPNMDDILRQNPDLMRQFQTAAVNSMSQSSPGLSGFMSNIINSDNSPQQAPQYSANYGGNNAGGGLGGFDKMASGVGVGGGGGGGPRYDPGFGSASGSASYRSNVNNRASDINIAMTRPDFSDDNIHIRESFAKTDNTKFAFKTQRTEMKGPSDISEILSGLKTKTINIKESQNDDKSTISISELKEMQNEGKTKKSSRRQKSDKNIVSLDI